MERYFVIDEQIATVLFESNASIDDVKRAVHNYRNDAGAIESGLAFEKNQEGNDEYVASLVHYLRHKGFFVKILALTFDGIDGFFDKHYGEGSIFMAMSVASSGERSEYYHHSQFTNGHPLTIITRNTGGRRFSTRLGDVLGPIYSYKLGGKKIQTNEIRTYIRGMIS